MKRLLKNGMAAAALLTVLLAAALPARAEIKDEKYLKMRNEVKSLYLVQSLLSWFVRTQGERSVFQESYVGHEDLFSKENILYFDKLLKKNGLSTDDRRMVQYMKNAFLLEFVSLDTAHFDDEINNAESGATVKLDWEPKPVPYQQIMVMMAQEKDPEKRQKLQAAQAKVWKEKLNPIYEKQEERVQQLSKALGYSDYVALSQDYRAVNLKDLIAKSQNFYKETDALYRKLLAEEVDAAMGVPVSKFTRADIQYLASVPHMKQFFPAELVVPAFTYFLEGMGLDLKSAAGTEIKIDDELRDKKEPRAACYSMTVPDDVRITVKPSGGVSDFETFFHEGGHALHFANTKNPNWEFQQLGNNAVTEGFAGFFESIWGEYEWLVKYRELVKNYNKFRKPEDRVPVMKDRDIGLLIRNRVFWDIYMARRYNGAKLIYETILHGGSPDIYKGFYKGQTKDPQQAYKALFSDAYGFQLSDSDALRFRTDVDSFFYAVDYARAFLLAAQMNESMRKKHGVKWFSDPKAGKLLREKLWTDGGKLQADELAKLIGSTDANYGKFKERIDRRMKIVKKLLGESKGNK